MIVKLCIVKSCISSNLEMPHHHGTVSISYYDIRALSSDLTASAHHPTTNPHPREKAASPAADPRTTRVPNGRRSGRLLQRTLLGDVALAGGPVDGLLNGSHVSA